MLSVCTFLPPLAFESIIATCATLTKFMIADPAQEVKRMEF